MQKIIDWFLEVYQNEDLAIKRKSLYTLYFVLLGNIMVIGGFIIETLVGLNTIISSIISIFLFLFTLFLIKKGKLHLVTFCITTAGTLYALSLLFSENNSTVFFTHCLLGIFMISMIHIRKIDYYIALIVVGTVIMIKIVKLQLIADTPEAIVQGFYLFMIFVLFLILSLLITKIIDDEISRSRDLIITNEELEESNKAKVDFIANVSHELRTPLNGIIGTAELISFNKESFVFKKDLNTILTSSKHLMTLINQILNISKINHKNFELKKSYFSLKELIEEIELMFCNIASEKKIDFYVFLSTKISHKIYCDKLKLKQVLINLLSNAFKFTEHGSISLFIEKIESSLGKEKIIFSVQDSGIGIKLEDQEQIFEEFRQSEINCSKQYEGTGLGLAISSKIIENMDSKILVQAEIGKGSLFSFELLCEVKTEIESINISEKEILLISEDEQSIKYFTKCFDDFGITYYIADSVEEAEEYSFELSNQSYVFTYGENINREIKTSSCFNENEIYFFNNKFDNKNVLRISQKHIGDIILDKDKEISPVSYGETLKNNFLGVRALIIEDNPINSDILKRYLKLSNIKSEVAKDSDECDQLIQKNIYNIIFLDIQLPRIDGFEVLKRIKNKVLNEPKVIAFTASISEEFKNKCIDNGFDDFIAKPFIYSDIEMILKKYLSFNLKEIAIVETDYENEMLTMLKSDYTEKLDRIEFYIEKENFDKIMEISHYMKSGAGSTNQLDLYKALSDLEIFAKNRDKENTVKTYKTVFNELNKIKGD